MVNFAQSHCRFDQKATILVDLSRDGEFLCAKTNDPQVHLKLLGTLGAGWCRFVAHLDGAVENPRVYLDFGDGMSEPWAVNLEWSEVQGGYRAVTWLPAPVTGMRFDPSDKPSRLRIDALLVDPLSPDEVSASGRRALMAGSSTTHIFAQSRCKFDRKATILTNLRHDGEFVCAVTDDPQIHLAPSSPLPAGWCQFVAHVTGEISNPRVYLDFGDGMSEAWVVDLERNESQDGYWAVTWLPAPASRVRFDPSDQLSRFRVDALLVDPLTPGELTDALSRPRLVSPARDLSGLRRLLARLERAPRLQGSTPDQIAGANTRVTFSEFSHLSGLSIRLENIRPGTDSVVIEVYDVRRNGVRLLRSAALDLEDLECHEWEHIYWEDAIDEARSRFFLVRAVALRDGSNIDIKVLTGAKPINSPPTPYTELPHAALFSPVTQCNLNCTHCISRPTRTKLKVASDRVWEAVTQMTRRKPFLYLAMDYSGDILFNELRHGGQLSRIIELDVPFRIDTNANCLEDEIIEKLLHSRLFEINFSLDSMDPEVYPRIRRGAIPLAEVLHKIGRFMERKKSSGKMIKSVVSFVLMSSNANTIKPALSFAKEHGIDIVNVIPMIAFTRDMVDELLVWDIEAYDALYGDLMAEAARLGVALAMQPPVKRWRRSEGHAPCNIPWGSAVITGTGDVMACCVPGTTLGNLNEKSLHEIWNGPEFRAFRMRVNSPNPPDPCRNCPMNRIVNNRKAYAPALYLPAATKKLERGSGTVASIALPKMPRKQAPEPRAPD